MAPGGMGGRVVYSGVSGGMGGQVVYSGVVFELYCTFFIHGASRMFGSGYMVCGRE